MWNIRSRLHKGRLALSIGLNIILIPRIKSIQNLYTGRRITLLDNNIHSLRATGSRFSVSLRYSSPRSPAFILYQVPMLKNPQFTFLVLNFAFFAVVKKIAKLKTLEFKSSRNLSTQNLIPMQKIQGTEKFMSLQQQQHIQGMYRHTHKLLTGFYCYVSFSIFSCDVTLTAKISHIACSSLSRDF